MPAHPPVMITCLPVIGTDVSTSNGARVAHSKKKRAIDHKGPTINDRVTALPQNRLHKVVRRLHQRARRGATSYLTSASSLFFLSSEVSRFWVAGAGAFVFSRPSRCLTIFVHAPMSGRRERVKRAASNAPLSGTFHQTTASGYASLRVFRTKMVGAAAVLAVCGWLALLEGEGGDGTHGTRVGFALRKALASRNRVGAGQVHMVAFSKVSTLSISTAL